MEGVDFGRRRRQSVFAHSGQNLDHFFSEVSCAEVIQVVGVSSTERLTNDHYSSVMSVYHLSVLFTSEEA